MTTTAPRHRPGRHARGRTGRRHRRDRSSTSSSRRTPCPRSTTRSSSTSSSTARRITVTAEVAQQIGEGRVRCICMQQTDGLVRGAAGAQPRPGHHGARSATPSSATSSTCSASRSTPTTSSGVDDYWEIHRSAPGLRPARAAGPDVRDRHQGHRPARALRAGWQDRPLRRCRRGQDRHHPGDDPPGRPAARRCVGVRRRRRAHP